MTSCLTPLTGLTPEHIALGSSLEEALATLRAALPREAYLVGQNIRKDTEWLQLQAGVDRTLARTPHPSTLTLTPITPNPGP